MVNLFIRLLWPLLQIQNEVNIFIQTGTMSIVQAQNSANCHFLEIDYLSIIDCGNAVWVVDWSTPIG